MFEISPFRPEERARWQQLWGEYQRFYKVELPDAVTASLWQRMQAGKLHGLGARDATGELQGIVHYLFHADTWSEQDACYLQDLYVHPSTRGTGCGRQLIQAVAAAAKRAGANAPYWLTHETNAPARRLYDTLATNHGFIQYAFDANR